ncbi:hypothetical protein APR12_001496 [Nocardia amikacinitolerans]|uniref:hypothetical protein n=1 Tax=Nocardia amikacinitolerans TaxID=756689 RepID=UPI000B32539C|nr:hypothetical protein [Nocardia amikacinitolerans]MCP2316159.1 hypothetical protein [Nocardia amikacinitolerans]
MQPYGPPHQPGHWPGHAAPPGHPQYPQQHGAPLGSPYPGAVPGHPSAGPMPGYPPHGMPGRPRSNNRLLLGLGGAAVVVVIALVVGTMVFRQVSKVDPPFEAMSRAFPQLLPTENGGAGYQGAKCTRYGPDDVERYDLGGMRFGKWTGAWECEGGSDDVEFTVYSFRDTGDVRSGIDSTGAHTEYTDVNGGVTYTNFELYGCCRVGPKLVTVFFDDADRSDYMLYLNSQQSFDQLKKWWRSAPLD